MFQSSIGLPDLAAILRQAGDGPLHLFAPSVLSARVAAFQRGFPGQVTFAVKSNPDHEVISALWAAGIAGFDVASPKEIALVRSLCPGAELHYNNPVRSRAEVAAGIAAGVVSWSVDEPGELDKLAGIAPESEIAVRFRLPVAGAAYDFGSKFGAEPDQAAALLARVAAMGMRPALTFHVGTQCRDPKAWMTYMAEAARIAATADVRIRRLNVGGGFPSARDGQPVDLKPYFEAFATGVRAFPVPPVLVCEPGRGLVADAYSYAVRVKSVRPGRVYLTDGIYGGLSEMPSMGVPVFDVLTPNGDIRTGPRQPVTVFGPTCDSLDRLPGLVQLPATLAEGDWIVFRSMGAYVTGVSTHFNGYGVWRTEQVAGIDLKNGPR